MPKPVKKRYVFTSAEIERLNAAFFDLLEQPEKVRDVFEQIGLPSLAALYLDGLKGQIEPNKQQYIEAIIRDVYRLAGLNPYRHVIDIEWALHYLSLHSKKALYIELQDLMNSLKSRTEQESKELPDYNGALIKLLMHGLIMQGNTIFIDYPLADTRVANLPVLVEITHALQASQEEKLKQHCVRYINELVEAIYQRLIVNRRLALIERLELTLLRLKVMNGDYAGALNLLRALKSKHVLSQIADALLEAHVSQNFQGLSVKIADCLKAFQTELFAVFTRDVHRLGGITLYHPDYPQGKSLSINVHNREIVETDVASKNEIHRLTYDRKQDSRTIITQYLQERFHLNNQDIAYILLNMSQDDYFIQNAIAANLAYKFTNENVLVFQAIPPNNLFFNLILDSHNHLRYLIGQSRILGRQDGENKNNPLGTANLVHEIPSERKLKLNSVESYLPGHFCSVNVSVVYEPECPKGELHYLSEQRLSIRIVNFLLRPIAYLKTHPFKSLLWFSLAASVTAALILAWPLSAGLLMGTGVAGIAAAITSFVSSLTVILLMTAPVLMGLGFWGLIAMLKGGESHSRVIQMVESDANFVSDKIAELIAEAKKESAQAQPAAASEAHVLNRLAASDQPAPIPGANELYILSPAGSSKSVLSATSQDSGELHPPAIDEAVSDKKTSLLH